MSFSLTIALLILLAFGVAGAFLGRKLPIPAAVLLGTMVGATIASGLSMLLGLPKLSVPSPLTQMLQVLLGMLVGFRMSREALVSGAKALVPSLVLILIFIPTAVASALIVAPLTSLDEVTLIFAAAPGGVTEMTTVSLGFGADGAAVGALQFVRVLLAVALVGVVVSRFGSKEDSQAASDEGDEQEEDGASAEESGLAEDLKRLAIAAPWGVAAGVVGIVTSLPAAGIIGALLGTTAFRIITDRSVPTTKYQNGVQMLSGGVIGVEISGRFLNELFMLAIAGALIICVQLVLWFGVSWLLVKLFNYDVLTAALASSPGGISGVVPAANQVGADIAVVSFAQLTRLGSIVAVVPVFVSLFFGGS